MTEAGQLQMDDAIWHEGKVWWVATIGSTGDVTFVDEPEPGDGQVQQLVLERHEEVVRAGVALMEARGAHDEAVQAMRHARRSLDFEMAGQRERRAIAAIEAMDAAGVVAGFTIGGDLR